MNTVTLVAFHLLLATAAFRFTDAAGCPGCSSDVSDPNSKNIRDVISRTLGKTNAGYTLTNVKNCKSQLVAGMKYDCEIEIKSPSGQVSDCQLSVVQRPWLKDDKEQIISESCSSVSRAKREVCAGCPSEVDANSDEMKKRLTGVLRQTNSGLSLVRGTHCTSQVVAGMKYTCSIQVESPQTNGVQTCELVFVDQPWKTPKTVVMEDTCSQLVRNKRSVCAGCPIEQDADTPEMKKTLSGILSQTNSGLTLVKGKTCTSQVVSGVKYTCTMEVTSPKINGVETCKISFLEQPWINPDPQIISDSCSQLTRTKREVCAGCPIEQDPHNPEMEKKMSQALSQTNSGLGLVGVEKCTSQVVAGILYDCTIRVNSPKFNGVETCHMKVLEQPWISKEPQVVGNTCSQLNNRVQRDLLGGLKEVDGSEKVLVQELATFAVKTLDDIDADNNKRVVTDVIRAQKQLVNGIMYYLKLRVRQTSCDEDKEINDECVNQDSAPQKICNVQVYRSFADKSPLNAKVVKSECEPVADVKKVGGYEPVQTNGDEVQKAATFAAKRVSEMVNSMYVKRLISIEKAETQVVSGVNYAMTLLLGDTDCMKNKMTENSVCKIQQNAKTNLVCEVVVHEKPWENVMKLTSVSCKDIPNVSVQRTKRAVLGGYQPAQTNGDEVEKAAQFAAKRINERVNSIYVKKVIAIEQAQTQVVAGTNYALTLLLGDTNCMKNEAHDNSDCKLLSNSKMNMLCEVVVYVNLDNVEKLTSMNCNDIPNSQLNREKRAIVGGYQPVQTNGDEVEKAAQFAAKRINERVNSIFVKKVIAIEQAQMQVVAGTNYALTLLLGDTNCMKNIVHDNSECKLLSHSKMNLLCQVVVYVNLENVEKLTSMNCNDVPKSQLNREKRKVLGGYEPAETNSNDVQEVADFAAEKINAGLNSIYVKKVIAVERALTQVVSGTNYDLTILLGDTECTKNKVHGDLKDCKFLSDSKTNLLCQVVVYINPWEKIKKVTSQECKDVPSKLSGRAKREVLAGGVSDVDVNDPSVQALNGFLSYQITERTNSPNLFRVVKTLSAKRQVVAGISYHLKVVASLTECPANVNADPETCPLSNSPNNQICDVVVWDRPWLRKREVTSINCNKQQTIEESEDDVDPNDKYLKKLASMLNTTMDDVEFHQFSSFLASHEKTYFSQTEYRKRFRIFRANMKKVKYLQETEQGTGQYGATQFADLTKSEFKKYYLGYNMQEGRWPERPQAKIPDVTLPLEYDWRDYNAVTKVKNQGMCGSCWAFSVTGNIEGQYAIKNQNLISLSEQELVDCDKYDSGCQGGEFDSAFHAIEDIGGLETESDYPYEGENDQCRFSSGKVRVTITGSVNVSSDETDMAKWLYKNGPISVALNANAMQFYMGGVSHPLKFLCSPDSLDHGVLIVGYGVHTTSILKRHLPYWIVKNSWGPGWGKQGYYWLYRGDGSCGINKNPTSAILE